MVDNKEMKQRRKPKPTDGKEVLRLVTHNMIRDIVVPGSEPNMYPAVIDHSKYERLRSQAKIISTQERLNILKETEKRKNQQMQDCLSRKEQVNKWEKQREKGAKLKDLEIDAYRRTTHLLQRADDLRQEQMDEVKGANQLILGTKYHAIRDAQITEKRLDEMEAFEKKQVRIAQTKEELFKINQQIQYVHEMEREESRIAELKVQEFMRLKAEREAAKSRKQCGRWYR